MTDRKTPSLRIFTRALAVLAASLPTATAHAEQLQVRSQNPFNFVEILSGTQTDPVDLSIDLQRPAGHRPGTKVPAVLFVHGAGGPQAHHERWRAMFRKLGLATAYADHFAPRGKASAVGSHIQLTGAAMTADAFSILKALAAHPDIDPDRIAIMGASKGGGVALYSAWKPLQEKLSPGRRFAAHIALYPTCVLWNEPDPTGAPVFVLLGAEDNWTGVDQCRMSVGRFRQAGHDEFSDKVYPNARHGFDSSASNRSIPNAYSVVECVFSIGRDGKDYADGLFMNTPQNKRKALSNCIKRGVTYGGNRDALNAAQKDVGEFLRETLLK